MRILLLGAGGFIGRHILSELLAAGHRVTAVVRRTRGIAEAFPDARFIEMDLAKATALHDWELAVLDVDVIANAAGVLQGASAQAIHVDMPAALHAAARANGVKRTVLISAISARADVATEYSRSKLAGEDVVRGSGLSWTILRPSLVYGDGSYGGTSLMRGMAALPGFIPVPGTGHYSFSPIHVMDLARAVLLVCENDRFDNRNLEPVGPNTLTLQELLVRYRFWLGFGRARILRIPMALIRACARLGDAIGSSPISSTSLDQMIAGNGGDSAVFAQTIGFEPRSLNEALQARPAQVQDRWHARLFFLAPAIRATLVILWLASAMLGLTNGSAATAHFVSAAGIPASLADTLRMGTSIADLLIATLVLMDARARWSTRIQVGAILTYSVVLGITLPELWLDPLGPLLKNLPIMILVLVHGAISDKR